jgi:serine/threonine protein kinase
MPTLPADKFSPEFRDFVNQTLTKDPAVRGTAKSLMSHPFLADKSVAVWPFTDPFEADEAELDLIANAVIEKYYPNKEFANSLFDRARFGRLAEMLGVELEPVEKAFHSKLNRVSGATLSTNNNNNTSHVNPSLTNSVVTPVNLHNSTNHNAANVSNVSNNRGTVINHSNNGHNSHASSNNNKAKNANTSTSNATNSHTDSEQSTNLKSYTSAATSGRQSLSASQQQQPQKLPTKSTVVSGNSLNSSVNIAHLNVSTHSSKESKSGVSQLTVALKQQGQSGMARQGSVGVIKDQEARHSSERV